MTPAELKKKALDYHRLPKPGKLSVESSKPCSTQADLSLAYTPGVAQPVLEIAKNPKTANALLQRGQQAERLLRFHSPIPYAPAVERAQLYARRRQH